jgi:hypothetical protein
MRIKPHFLVLTSLFCLFAFVITLTNCKKSDDDTCDTTDVSYKNDLLPLFTSKGCMASGCHGAGAQFDYTVYNNLNFVAVGQRLVGAVKQEAGFSAMPKGGAKIDACSISIIEAWVTQGAKNN